MRSDQAATDSASRPYLLGESQLGVRTSVPRPAVKRGHPQPANGVRVLLGDVADVLLEPVPGIAVGNPVHVAVTRRLGDHRRGRDGGAPAVAADDPAVLDRT